MVVLVRACPCPAGRGRGRPSGSFTLGGGPRKWENALLRSPPQLTARGLPDLPREGLCVFTCVGCVCVVCGFVRGKSEGRMTRRQSKYDFLISSSHIAHDHSVVIYVQPAQHRRKSFTHAHLFLSTYAQSPQQTPSPPTAAASHASSSRRCVPAIAPSLVTSNSSSNTQVRVPPPPEDDADARPPHPRTLALILPTLSSSSRSLLR